MRFWCRKIDILQQQAAEIGYGKCGIYCDRAESGDVLAGMRICAHVLECWMGQEDKVDRGSVSFQLGKHLDVEGRVPADVYQDFDVIVKLYERLGSRRVGLRAEERSEEEHGRAQSAPRTRAQVERL